MAIFYNNAPPIKSSSTVLTLLKALAVLSAPDIRELKRTAGQDKETDVLWLLKFSRHERALKACIATVRLVASLGGLFRLFYLAAELQTLDKGL